MNPKWWTLDTNIKKKMQVAKWRVFRNRAKNEKQINLKLSPPGIFWEDSRVLYFTPGSWDSHLEPEI